MYLVLFSVTHHGAVILDCVGGSEDRSIKLWNLELPGEKEPAAYRSEVVVSR